MDLTLNLGESPARPVEEIAVAGGEGDRLSMGMKHGFCMGLDFELLRRIKEENRGGDEERRWSVDPPVQLNLLPLTPVHRLDSTQLSLPWPTEDKIGNSESVSVEEAEERAAIPSSPAIRAVSSLHMNLAVNEKENDVGRKKLRLSKEQSTFLEESFKEQNTLNSKLKFVLAKQLDLRPRQIEVWFQNRRARTKLKQMEMDCEFLKRRCEALREENRRLHKEVTELRAIKTFNNQIMPPTTLFICPSCERISPPTSPLQPPATPR